MLCVCQTFHPIATYDVGGEPDLDMFDFCNDEWEWMAQPPAQMDVGVSIVGCTDNAHTLSVDGDQLVMPSSSHHRACAVDANGERGVTTDNVNDRHVDPTPSEVNNIL